MVSTLFLDGNLGVSIEVSRMFRAKSRAEWGFRVLRSPPARLLGAERTRSKSRSVSGFRGFVPTERPRGPRARRLSNSFQVLQRACEACPPHPAFRPTYSAPHSKWRANRSAFPEETIGRPSKDWRSTGQAGARNRSARDADVTIRSRREILLQRSPAAAGAADYCAEADCCGWLAMY